MNDKTNKFLAALQEQFEKEYGNNDPEWTLVEFFRDKADELDRMCLFCIEGLTEVVGNTKKQLTDLHSLLTFRGMITKALEEIKK